LLEKRIKTLGNNQPVLTICNGSVLKAFHHS